MTKNSIAAATVAARPSTKRRGRLRATMVAGAMAAALASFTTQTAMAEGDPTTMEASNGADTLQDQDVCGDANSSYQFRFRFYYHSDFKGAWVNVGHPVWDLKYISTGVDPAQNPLRFCGNGDGGGQQVANNAASAANWFDHYCGVVYYHAGYGGAQERVYPHEWHNLGVTKNNDRSITFTNC